MKWLRRLFRRKSTSKQRNLTASELRAVLNYGRLPPDFARRILRSMPGEKIEIELDGIRLTATIVSRTPDRLPKTEPA